MTDSTVAICGTAEVVQRPGERPLGDALGPIELMVDAALRAADEAGDDRILRRVEWIGVVGGLWHYADPGRLIGEAIGAPFARTACSGLSGTSPLSLIGLAAERIERGQLDVALVVGGEARWSSRRVRAQHIDPSWQTDRPGMAACDEQLPGVPDETLAEYAEIGQPAAAYALFEDAIRAAERSSLESHRRRIAQLWERFSAVAAAHPAAWDRTPHTADQILAVSDHNRMIADPYTKAMVANNTVDMASAILLCSRAAADSLGIAGDRLVFPRVVVSGYETLRLLERPALHRCDTLAAAGRLAYAHAGVTAADLTHVDLYACFPSIVQMSTAALGVDRERALTVTGGLGFAGAPIANAAGQSTAAIVPRVREGGVALVHGNGGNATTQVVMILADRPGARPYASLAAPPPARAPLAHAPGWSGAGRIEAATATHVRQQPVTVLAVVVDGEGRRGFATSVEQPLVEAVAEAALTGRMASVHDGTLRVA